MKQVPLGFLADAQPEARPGSERGGTSGPWTAAGCRQEREGSQGSTWHYRQEGNEKAWSTDQSEKTKFFFGLVSQTKMSFGIHVLKKNVERQKMFVM